MSSSSPQSASKRSSSRTRGNRRRSGSGNASRKGGRPQRRRAPVKPPTLMERILGFFGFGPVAVRKKSAARKKSGSKQGSEKPRATGSSGQRKKTQPELREVTGPRLYVGNLSYDAKEEDIEAVFNGVGTVSSAEIVTNSRTQRSKGYGFIEMGSTEEAKRAVEELHDKELMGRKMVVSGAKPRDKQSAA